MFAQFHRECPTTFASTANFSPNSLLAKEEAKKQQQSTVEVVGLTHPSVSFDDLKRKKQTETEQTSTTVAKTADEHRQSNEHNDGHGSFSPQPSSSMQAGGAAPTNNSHHNSHHNNADSRYFMTSKEKMEARRHRQQHHPFPAVTTPSASMESTATTRSQQQHHTSASVSPAPSAPVTPAKDGGMEYRHDNGGGSTPRESPAKLILAQAELRNNAMHHNNRSYDNTAGPLEEEAVVGRHSADNGATRSGSRRSTSLLNPHRPEHHVDQHDEALTAVVSGLRIRAKLHCSFSDTLLGQIREINRLLKDTKAELEQGKTPYFKESALMTQRSVWKEQLVEFMTSEDTFAAIHLSQLPKRGKLGTFHEEVAPSRAAAAAAAPGVSASNSEDEDGGNGGTTTEGDASAWPQNKPKPKIKMLRRGERQKRMDEAIEQRRKAAAQQEEEEEAAQRKSSRRSGSRSASTHRSGSAQQQQHGSSEPHSSVVDADDIIDSDSYAQQQQQQQEVDSFDERPAVASRTPPAAKPAPKKVSAKKSVVPASSSSSATKGGGPLRPTSKPAPKAKRSTAHQQAAVTTSRRKPPSMFTSHEAEENAAAIERHIATIVAAADREDGQPIQHGRISSSFLDKRRDHFLSSIFPSSAEMRGASASSSAVPAVHRIGKDSHFFNLFDHRRYNEVKETIDAL